MQRRLFPFFSLLSVILLLSVVPGVLGLGVTPAKGTINFAPGSSGEFEILLLNSRPHEIETQLEIRGDLAEYFTATTPTIRARGSAVSVIRFDFPADITPGTHRHQFVYKESFFDPEGGGIGARTAIAFQLDVWKPYPGRYAELSLHPEHVAEGKNSQVRIDIRSRGDQPVQGDVEITITDPDGTTKDAIVLPNVYIEGDSDWRRFAELKSVDWEPGKYTLAGTYDYAASVAEAEATFIVGTRNVRIENITRTYYKDKEVNRFVVDVESMWNQPIDSVSATMQLGRTSGGTPTITLAPFTRKGLTGYWDTDTSLAEGTHEALVTVRFSDGEPVQRLFSVQVHNETPQPQEESPAIVLGTVDVLFFLILLVLVAYFCTQVWKRHRRR